MNYQDRYKLSQQFIFEKDSIYTKQTSISPKSNEEQELATSLSYQTKSSINEKKQKETSFQRDYFLNDSQHEGFQNDENLETLIEIKGQQKKILYKTVDQFQKSFTDATYQVQMDQNLLLCLKIVLVRELKKYNFLFDTFYEKLMEEYLDFQFNMIDKSI